MLFRQLTLFKVTAYIFIFALCAKGVYYYASDHPGKENLISVKGTVIDIKIGGKGNSTNLKVDTGAGIHKYSSYYGTVWPGMESIKHGDEVNILAEKNRLNKNELFEGKSYYIWELKHDGQIIINYSDVNRQVTEKESVINRYINYWVIISFFIFLYAMMRRDIKVT